MNINNINLQRLRNGEHVQFHCDFISLVEQFSAEISAVHKSFKEYQAIFAVEKKSLNVVEKSVTTQHIAMADKRRDKAFKGLKTGIKTYLYHYEEDKIIAAKRLKILFDSYGNVPANPYDEATAKVTSIVRKLTSEYSADSATLGFTDWVKELDAANQQFEELKNTRYSESASKRATKMKDVRVNVDTAYYNIITSINALIVINGADLYVPFIKEMNARVESYSFVVAQRVKRNGKVEAVDNEKIED